ncbi:DNA-directed DNA polymerase [Quillaja saponaria]|uniref:DNA-directed DNA polymerase n=1 Tax=Quillaja saponaria TaxID=32244 RepID=A0AAD7VHR2_QUISA|nr:DNA-directed DNA polymerase [Quillaja saponaria]
MTFLSGCKCIPFYNGLGNQTRTIIDTAASGTLIGKSTNDRCLLPFGKDGLKLLSQWLAERLTSRRVVGLYEIDAIAALMAQVAGLRKRFDNFGMQQEAKAAALVCEAYGEGYTIDQCPNIEVVQYVHNFNHQNNPYSNTYNPGWRNHPNLGWNNQGSQAARSNPPPGF